MDKAVFIDKDGTLVKDVPYNADPHKVVLEPGAGKALAALQAAGFMLVLVTNQSGVAHGYFPEEDLFPVFDRIQELLAADNVRLNAVYYCPHHPAGKIERYRQSCICRKPRPGMLLHASRDYQLNLHESWMIGDILHDIEAGNRAGCRTILIDNGHETEWVMNAFNTPAFRVPSLTAAADTILEAAKNKAYGNLF
jgi:D,D-heptose 1,7-bisphosphate phosphatase